MLRKLFGIAMMFITMTAATLGYVTSGPTLTEPTTTAPETVVTAFCNGYLGDTHQAPPQIQPANTLPQKATRFGVKATKKLADYILRAKARQAQGGGFDLIARITGSELQSPLATDFYDGMPSLFEYYHLDEDVAALLATLENETDRLLHLAHNLPDDFSVVESGQVTGDTATVTVRATWNGSAELHTLAFTLVRVADAWVITDVTPLD
jgi:hypothetical protein